MKISKILLYIGIFCFLLLFDSRLYAQTLKEWKYSNMLRFKAPDSCKQISRSINELSIAQRDFSVKIVMDKSLTKLKQSITSPDKTVELSGYLDKLTNKMGYLNQSTNTNLKLDGFNVCYEKIVKDNNNVLVGVMFDKVFTVDFYFVITYNAKDDLLAENVMKSFTAIDYGF